MLSFFIGLLTVGLVLISLFLILIVLMQRSSSNSGMGAAIGGGVAESAFGTSTDSVLARGTVYGAVLFFVMTFLLYLSYLGRAEKQEKIMGDVLLPQFAVEEVITETHIEATPASEAPATTEAPVEAAK